MLELILIIASLILLGLATIGQSSGRFNLGWAGILCAVLAFALTAAIL